MSPDPAMPTPDQELPDVDRRAPARPEQLPAPDRPDLDRPGAHPEQPIAPPPPKPSPKR